MSEPVGINRTTFAKILKYIQKEPLEKGFLEKDPLFAIMPKDTSLGGNGTIVPLKLGRGQAQSASSDNVFNMVNEKTAARYNRFIVTGAELYHVERISNLLMKTVKSNAHAFAQGLAEAWTDLRDAMMDRLCHGLYRDGGALLGKVSSVTGAVVTLVDADDAQHFVPGTPVQFATAADGTGAQPAWSSTDTTAVVKSVDIINGKVTFHGDVSGASYADSGTNDFIIHADSVDSDMKGLQAFLCSDIDDTPALHGLSAGDRDGDSRFAGLYLDGSSYSSFEELIQDAAEYGSRWGRPDTLVMHTRAFNEFVKELGSKEEVSVPAGGVNGKKRYDFSAPAIRFHGAKGPVDVMGSTYCPSDEAFMLQKDTWKLLSAGDPIEVLQYDGNSVLHVNEKFQGELRGMFYGNPACKFPGKNVRIALPSY